ncbi:pre-piRNA 3'-exonuclease trimmer isoform X2 [Nematostella vectensis]|uniref:pre-piRNA 3'-exonuclease trimmer isoform X2 n=1 Tax=Nematostella vectensis TaxID=45351 RepID=UPI0020778AC0|nr:pre-piRNA 3'-exonuclease trimmer isoform X2 [Nematostella vectensis]
MCEVTRSNFEAHFEEISGAIEKSVFVAIDTEFTGLYANDTCKPCLFDNAEAIYKKQKKTVSQVLISQFGLSMFEPVPDHPGRYKAHVFNCYLFPCSFGAADCRFLCQASSLEFLCQHDFDFNKFVYQGVPFLNEEQESMVRSQHNQKTLHAGMQSLQLRDIDDQIISCSCNKVDEWLKTANIGDNMTLNAHTAVGQYLLLLELQKQSTMNQLRYEVQDLYQIVITRQTNCSEEAMKKHLAEQEERILLSVIGFSRIFKLLVKHKKPLIGHNMFTDLMLIYDKLYKPLPDCYDDFKADIHRLFPYVYDTKHIAFKIRKQPQLKECEFLDSTNLEDLQTALESREAKYYVLYNPLITLSKSAQRYEYENHPHEAGYDSYLAGFAFLRIAHLYAAKLESSQLMHPLPFARYLQVLKPYANQVNIGRASIPYVDLANQDPPSGRPQWFFVTSLGGKPIEGHEIANQFIRFGSVDVRVLDRHHALVAVAYHRRVKDLLKLVKKSKRISVRLYNPFLDSTLMRNVIWFGGIAGVFSACVGCGILLWKKL